MFETYINDGPETYINDGHEHRDKTPEEIRAFFDKYDPQNGKRYHDYGNFRREYEPELPVAGVYFPVSDVFEMRQRAKEKAQNNLNTNKNNTI